MSASPRLTELPLEMLIRICAALDKPSAMCMRAVARLFSIITCAVVFEHVTLVPRISRFRNLQKLSTITQYARHVRRVTIGTGVHRIYPATPVKLEAMAHRIGNNWPVARTHQVNRVNREQRCFLNWEPADEFIEQLVEMLNRFQACETIVIGAGVHSKHPIAGITTTMRDDDYRLWIDYITHLIVATERLTLPGLRRLDLLDMCYESFAGKGYIEGEYPGLRPRSTATLSGLRELRLLFPVDHDVYEADDPVYGPDNAAHWDTVEKLCLATFEHAFPALETFVLGRPDRPALEYTEPRLGGPTLDKCFLNAATLPGQPLSFGNLKRLELLFMATTEMEIRRVIELLGPRLEHLKLWRCEILEWHGGWLEPLRRLPRLEKLKSLSLTDLRDDEGCWVGHFQPSSTKDGAPALLNAVNEFASTLPADLEDLYDQTEDRHSPPQAGDFRYFLLEQLYEHKVFPDLMRPEATV